MVNRYWRWLGDMKVHLSVAAGEVESMGRPAIVVAIVIVHSDSSRLAVPRGLGSTPMFGGIYRECAEQEQQQGCY
ncbi:MAG TPA: hypothetical protein VEX68_17120 [Bryobacteraceae bacterium]|nr:hypothetical protein [Bryobacteraceae bacterium]